MMNSFTQRVTGFVLACMIMASGAYACGDAQGEDPPWPDGLIVETPTADLREVVAPDVGAAQLGRDHPSIARVLEAISSGDTEEFLSLIQWQEMPCGTGATYCPGVKDGDLAPVVDAGSAVSFFVTAEALRPYLDSVLSGTAPPLTFASRLKDDKNVYYVAFESEEAKGFGDVPLLEPDRPIHGLFLKLDATSSTPIAGIDFGLTPGYTSDRKARELGLENQELIVFPVEAGSDSE